MLLTTGQKRQGQIEMEPLKDGKCCHLKSAGKKTVCFPKYVFCDIGALGSDTSFLTCLSFSMENR